MILIAEDNPLIRMVCKDILDLHGYVNLTFENGNSTIDWLSQKKHCDLVVTDMNMENGTGIDIIEWLNANRPYLPAILITGNSTQKYDKLLKTLNIPVLNKPFRETEFIEKIQATALYGFEHAS